MHLPLFSSCSSDALACLKVSCVFVHWDPFGYTNSLIFLISLRKQIHLHILHSCGGHAPACLQVSCVFFYIDFFMYPNTYTFHLPWRIQIQLVHVFSKFNGDARICLQVRARMHMCVCHCVSHSECITTECVCVWMSRSSAPAYFQVLPAKIGLFKLHKIMNA